MKCSCGRSHKTHEDQERSHRIEKQQFEYIRYALAKFICYQKRIAKDPSDKFAQTQMTLHLQYSERLLGKNNYGINPGE